MRAEENMGRGAVRQSHRGGLRTVSWVFAAVPFVFALIRGARTGDLRYLWVAAASLVGAVVTSGLLRAGATPTKSALWLPAAVFTVATLLACLAAVLLGTRLGPGVLIVGAAFGFWFAVGAGFHVLASRRTG